MPGGSRAAAGLCRALAALNRRMRFIWKLTTATGAIMKRKLPAQHNIDIDLDNCRLQLRLSARTGARMFSPHLWEF